MPAQKKLTIAECSTKCRSKKDAAKLISVICRSGDTESLIYLITKSLCNNAGKITDVYGRSPLHMASAVGKLKVIEYLLSYKGGQVNAKDLESGYSALHRALFHGQIHIAKVLISQYNANISLQDHDGLTALDHVSFDRSTFPKNYGCAKYHFASISNAKNDKNDVYVWGGNSNYNLGLGHHTLKPTPEINEFFRKDNAKCQNAKISKFHSAFLTDEGCVYTCGHGRGGRLGHGHSESLLSPKMIKTLSEHVITDVSLGIDHSIFLSKNGQVFVCGLNTYHQLGLKDKTEVTTPMLLNSAKSKLPSAKGIAASKFHSLYWTDDELYTWGLNAGQLGHMKNEKTIVFPKLVSSIKGQKISQVSSADGAIVVLTRNGDLMAINEYQTRRVASKLSHVVKIEALGGHLDISKCKSLLVEKGGQDLKIFVLNNIGRISVWHEKSPSLTQCLFNVSRELWIVEMASHRNGLLLLSKEGSAYEGLHQPKSSTASTSASGSSSGGSEGFFKFVEKDQCDSIKVKRIPFIHRGVKASVDPKGNNFCILQTQPRVDLHDLPQVGKRTLAVDMSNLYNEDDVLKDLEIKAGSNVVLRCHKYVLLASVSSQKLENHLVKESPNDLSNLTTLDLSEMSSHNNHHHLEQLLQYIYAQTCDLTKEGTLPFKPQKPQKAPEQNGFDAKDLNESAHKVYNNKKTKKGSEKAQVIDKANPLSEVQELAKQLGLLEMARTLDNYSYNGASNSIKAKKDAKISKHIKSWSRTKYEEISDVIILSQDKKEFYAHKCMLSARLDYFRSMFCMGWVEAVQETTVVSLPFPANLMQILLDFVYTDFDAVPSDDPEFLCNILVMADQLLIPRLVQICEKQLASLLTLKNVGEILQLSCEFNAEQLRKCCMDFVCFNLGPLIEAKGLEVVDNEVLAKVSKHYQDLNRALATRKITPYSEGPSTEEIEDHAMACDFTLEELFELEAEALKEIEASVPSASSKKRRRQISTGSTGSSGASDNENDAGLNTNKTEDDEDSLLEDFQVLNVSAKTAQQSSSFTLISNKKSEDIIKSFFDNPQEFSKKISTTEQTTPTSKKFHKLSQKERKKLQNSTSPHASASEAATKPKWTGWGQPPQANDLQNGSSLSSIMQQEEAKADFNGGGPKSSPSPISNGTPSSSSSTTKRTRKQSWRSLSFDNSAEVLAQSPPASNPWKISQVDNEAAIAWPTPAQPTLHQILHEESKQSANLTKAKSKPFHVTQLEEKAMSELRDFYNADNVFDERITVQRVDQGVLATPIWKKSKR